jgi:hypothetical protein
VFLEDVEISGSFPTREISLEEIRVELPILVTQESVTPQLEPLFLPSVQTSSATAQVEAPHQPVIVPQQEQLAHNNEVQNPVEHPLPIPELVVNEPIRRSQQPRRFTIPNYYDTFLSEDMYDDGKVDDPISFKEAISIEHSAKWVEAMEDELKSMSTNDVWDLVEILDGFKPVGCKWVFKIKRDSKGNVDEFKARLIAKGYTQKKGLIIMKLFHLCLRKIHLESSWRYWLILI